jgi:hypothetical protein
MSEKIQGSAGGYLTVPEAAKLLGVKSAQVLHLQKQRYLDPHYPNGRKGGMHFLEEDVITLAELRNETRESMTQKLPRLAMRAIVTSRRTERQLEQLLHYLGLDAPPLPADREGILVLHHKLNSWIELGAKPDPKKALELARCLLALTEEYLEAAVAATGDPEAWKLYIELGGELSKRLDERDALRLYVEHARRNVRSAAYFYLRGAKGAREAGRHFQGERYTDRLLRALA